MSSDLASLFQPPPAGAAAAVAYRQGLVVAWNPITAENTVRVGGTDLSNLPTIASSAEVLAMQAGDAVGLLVIGQGAAAQMIVVGRLTLPGTPQAASALDLLGLGTAEVDATETTASTTFVDLTSIGPSVDVRIGNSGKALVFLSAIMVILAATSGAEMGYDVSGASTVAASVFGRTVAIYGAAGVALSGSRVVLQTGLSPGINTFTAKYMAGGGGGTAQFSYRNLTVLPL